MPIHRRPPAGRRPVVDEWGIYDPEQAGLSAVLNRLRERYREPAQSETPPNHEPHEGRANDHAPRRRS